MTMNFTCMHVKVPGLPPARVAGLIGGLAVVLSVAAAAFVIVGMDLWRTWPAIVPVAGS